MNQKILKITGIFTAQDAIKQTVQQLMEHKKCVLFQIRNQLEKLANGIHIGTNYRLYAVERVCAVMCIRLILPFHNSIVQTIKVMLLHQHHRTNRLRQGLFRNLRLKWPDMYNKKFLTLQPYHEFLSFLNKS